MEFSMYYVFISTQTYSEKFGHTDFNLESLPSEFKRIVRKIWFHLKFFDKYIFTKNIDRQ